MILKKRSIKQKSHFQRTFSSTMLIQHRLIEFLDLEQLENF